jgi:hypothetical protein
MNGYDDAQRLRNQRKASDTAASQPRGNVTRGAPCLVLQTATKTTYPTVAGAFYAAHIISRINFRLGICPEPRTCRATFRDQRACYIHRQPMGLPL